jgi:outer membrane protein OmpA-like peptidoglycan-associated protein
MTHSRLWRFVVACWLLAPASALAQEAKVRAIDVNLFRPSPSRYALFSTELTQTADPWLYTLALTYDYQKDPLVLRSFGRRIDGVVTDQQTMNLLFSIGLPYRLEVGLDIPFVTRMDGSGGRNLGLGVGGLETAGFGDIRLTPKFQALKKKGFGLGFAATVAFPTGRLTSFHGERSLNVMPKLLLDYEVWRLSFTGLAGYVFRNRAEFNGLVVGDELLWAVGAKLRILETVQGTAKADRLAVIGELYGRTNGNDPFNKFNENPMVALIGARYLFARYNLHVTAGVARGIQGGYGAPAIQPFVGVMWAPVEPDSDGDGVPDNRDRCPGLAGKAEWQGCPDTDGDGLPDHEDACPDISGPRDNKGCPYIDTDKDGIPDKDDKCPREKGPKENQGCPWPDTDGDGIPDKDDKCPDKPGPAKFEGCPDTDRDGVPDHKDKCPNEAGPADNEGCPKKEEPQPQVKEAPSQPEVKEAPPITPEIKLAERQIILPQIQFDLNSAVIKAASFPALDELAKLLNENPSVTLRIEGHTDTLGSKQYNLELSQRRADSVRRYLAQKGVDAKRLVAIGFGDGRIKYPKPEDKARNRRVEFHITGGIPEGWKIRYK